MDEQAIEGLESSLRSTDKSDNSSLVLIGNAYATLFDSAKLITSVSISVSNGISFPLVIYHVICENFRNFYNL